MLKQQDAFKQVKHLEIPVIKFIFMAFGITCSAEMNKNEYLEQSELFKAETRCEQYGLCCSLFVRGCLGFITSLLGRNHFHPL